MDPIALGQAKFIVQHADPRRLLADASLGTLSYAVVVLHAPCQATATTQNADQSETATQWWFETGQLLHSKIQALQYWVMIDANAAEPATRRVICSLHFLKTISLPFHLHFPMYILVQPPHGRIPSGKKSRKDYILVPKILLPLVLEARVHVEHDTTFLHGDHLPVMVLTKGWKTFGAASRKYA